MKSKFQCQKCLTVFEASGKKHEWNDPIYGPCFKYVAVCPDCNEESNEYRPIKEQSESSQNKGSACGCCSKAGNCGMAGY